MAGLYGDLPQAKVATGEAASSWGAPLLQPKPKPSPAILAPPPSLLRGRGGGRTPGGRGGGRGAAAAAAQGDGHEAAGLQGGGASATPTIFPDVKDEYDPMRPNDYEEVLKERERAKREAEAEAERVARIKEMEAAMERLKQQEEGASALQGSDDTRASMLNISGPDAYARRGQAGPAMASPASSLDSSANMSAGLGAAGLGSAGLGSAGLGSSAGLGAGGTPGAGAADKGGAASDKGMTLAQKMLMKMGWKEGEGLGRERQGISTPLVMQKTNARAGVIVNAEPVAGGGKPRAGAQIVGQPSRVLCLRNMVGPGEVDEELEDEVGQECTKYGTVTSVMIFEVTQPGYPSEEAVRIFVQFDRMESAMKALVDLQGRFFGGRDVRCAFFSEERFATTQLAPMAGEFD